MVNTDLILIQILMNQKTKQVLVKVKQHIQAKQYQQALDQCQILLMKNSKVFNAYMFSGFCYQKLNQDAKAEKAYIYAQELDEKSVDVAKALYALYTRLKKDASTKYLTKLVEHYKKVDKTKYTQYFKKLIKVYEVATDLETINKIFTKMKGEEKEIHQDFLAVGEAYYRVAVENECFQLDVFAEMGEGRRVSPECKEHLDKILLEIIKYIKKVSGDYDIKPEQMSETIMYLRECFPDSGIILYLSLIDQYMISHFETTEFLLNQIHALLSAFYESAQTPYSNLNVLNPQIFTVSMLLTYQYLRFLRQFFTVNETTQGYISKLQLQQQNLYKHQLSDQNKKIVSSFILRQAVEIGNSIDSPNASARLTDFRSSADKYGGFLKEVLARLAMNVFKGYKELNDMKNILKIRILNEPQNVFLLKYYYDYLIKIGRVFRVFDEEISIDDILASIISLDPGDSKYHIEAAWINFSRLVHEQTKEGIEQILARLVEIEKCSEFSEKDRAVLKKKILIIQVHLGKQQGILQSLEQILKLDPLNYRSLITIGAYLMTQQKYPQALHYLKKAFIIFQNDYHLNRYIYVCFMKVGNTNEAEYFTERIYPGFMSAFWTNYVYAMASINRRNYDLAETYLTKSIEIFVSSKEREYSVSYEKIYEREGLSSPYLILQNKYKILDEYLIVPEAVTESICPLVSNFFYKRNNVEIKKIRMWFQMGETLKILGRLSTSLKSLVDADEMVEKLLKENPSDEAVFIAILVKKELASIEFYYRNFKGSEALLARALQLHKEYNINNRNNVEAEIYGLYFEISIEKLLGVMKSETPETVSSYIKSFQIPETNYTSMSYLKSLYQLKILCYFHNKSGAEQCLNALNHFLNSFGLDFFKIQQKHFSDIYYSLSIDNKKLVQEAIQDLVVFGYISKKIHKNTVFKLQKQQLLSLLQLFPNNLILYIIYGIMVEDIKSKVGAFLKCVQIDPSNPISLYFLANLYLQQEKYLPAIQLYLKGIESNPLDIKSYYGLSLCLISMAIKGLNNIQQRLIKECFDKVHSFLEYIRTINSSMQYHFVDFVKILFYEKNLSEFDKKIKIQNGLKSYQQLRGLDQVIQNSFFDELLKDVSHKNVWKREGQQELISGFVNKYGGGKIESLGNILQKKVEELEGHVGGVEVNSRNREHLLEQVVLLLSLSVKASAKPAIVLRVYGLVEKVMGATKESREPVQKQLLACKRLLFRLAATFQSDAKQSLTQQIESLAPEIQIFDLILQDALKVSEHAYKRKLNLLIMKHPSNQFLKSRLEGFLLIKTNTPILKATTMSKQRLLSSQSKSHGYQKLMIYHNDPSAWILFIRQNFNSNMTQRRLIYWLRHLQANPILSTPQHLILYAEIYAKYQLKFGKEEKHWGYIQKNKQLMEIYNRLTLEFKLYRSLKEGDILSALKESKNPLGVGLNFLYQLVTKHKITKQLLEVFRNLSAQIGDDEYSKYFNLLWYICALNAQRNKDLPAYDRLAAIGQSSERLQILSDTNQYFVHISKSQLDSQPEKTDELLGLLSAYSLDSLEEKKLACYFDLMLVYGKVESHPEDQDIYENFQSYITHTEQLGDVNLNSFLHYLNGLVALRTNRGTLVSTPQQVSIQEFRKSILLNPANGKGILEKFK